ncbi:MAG: YcxB family protein [Clostridium sp.]|jgi:hypothetical protein|nr:YcxB family protein [Clostridium sp.]
MEFEVKINSGDLFDYLLAHTYHGAAGHIGSGVGAMLVIFGLARNQYLYLLVGIFLLLYQPVALFIKSKKQLLMNPVFANPIHYAFDAEGYSVSQGEAMQKVLWEELYKVTATSRSIMIYTTPVYASILPRRVLGEQTSAVIQLISTHVPHKKVKIRY